MENLGSLEVSANTVEIQRERLAKVMMGDEWEMGGGDGGDDLRVSANTRYPRRDKLK